jgi:hypothetical protein
MPISSSALPGAATAIVACACEKDADRHVALAVRRARLVQHGVLVFGMTTTRGQHPKARHCSICEGRPMAPPAT